jgi:hypothetical protein
MTPLPCASDQRSAAELDEWTALLRPPPAAAEEHVSQAEAKFALTLRRIVADAAVELLVDELEDLPA